MDGIEVVARPVAEAPYAIVVGVVELHQYAGVSGGHKAVAVGCGGRQTSRRCIIATASWDPASRSDE